NVDDVVGAFLSVLERDHGIPNAGDLVVGDDDRQDPGGGARVTLRSGHCLRMQVTRAMPEDVYKKQEHAAVDYCHAPGDASQCLRNAIERKSRQGEKGEASGNYKPGYRATTTLLIDGVAAPHLPFIVPSEFVRKHGAWALAQGWESIWVVGVGVMKRLDCSPA